MQIKRFIVQIDVSDPDTIAFYCEVNKFIGVDIDDGTGELEIYVETHDKEYRKEREAYEIYCLESGYKLPEAVVKKGNLIGSVNIQKRLKLFIYTVRIK